MTTTRRTLAAAAVSLLAACTSITMEQKFRNDTKANLLDYFNQQLAEAWTPAGRLEDCEASDERFCFGSLREAEADTLHLELDAGLEYGIIGSCDDDCVDLELRVDDPAGTPLARDVELPGEEKYPLARFPSEQSGTYRVRVEMLDCRSYPCSYGLWSLRKKETVDADPERD